MSGVRSAGVDVALGDVSERLSAMRLCCPEAQQQMQLSLSKLGQLTPIQLYRAKRGLELIDGFKRKQARVDPWRRAHAIQWKRISRVRAAVGRRWPGAAAAAPGGVWLRSRGVGAWRARGRSQPGRGTSG